MPLLNVVCFGPEDDYIHDHLLQARDRDCLFKDPTKFRLDEWHMRPQPGMLASPALITYVPAHAGQIEGGASFLSVKDVWATFSEFGSIGGKAVVLDACDTASDNWLYHRGRLRPECQALKDKPLLGGSGVKKPQKSHGRHILSALVDALSGIEDADLGCEKLQSLLEDVLDRAIRKAVSYSTLRTAYKVRKVSPTI